MELTRLKGRLRTAQRGHKLLKDKRDELMKQFMEVVREDLALRQKVEQSLARAYGSFTVASALMSPRALARIALDGNGVFLIFRDSHSVFPEKGRGAPRPFLLFYWKRSMSAVICPVKAVISLFERPLKRRMSSSSASPAASSLP